VTGRRAKFCGLILRYAGSDEFDGVFFVDDDEEAKA
jgi:hypothetical protein